MDSLCTEIQEINVKNCNFSSNYDKNISGKYHEPLLHCFTNTRIHDLVGHFAIILKQETN